MRFGNAISITFFDFDKQAVIKAANAYFHEHKYDSMDPVKETFIWRKWKYEYSIEMYKRLDRKIQKTQ